MANTDIVSRSGKGSSLSATDYDQNLNGLHGLAEEQTGTTYEVVYTDQGKTIELNNASMVCTLDAIADITALIDTTGFKVTLKNTNATAATVQRSSTDTIEGSTSITLIENEVITLQTDTTGSVWTIKSTGIISSNTALTSLVVNTSLKGTAIGRGALVYKSALESVATSTFTHLSWDTESYDTDTIHDTVTNNQRLTVPTGVTKIKLHANIIWFSGNTTGVLQAGFSKNDETTTPNVVPGMQTARVPSTTASTSQQISSSILEVTAGDYFTCWVYQSNGTYRNVSNTISIQDGYSYFAMEIIQ